MANSSSRSGTRVRWVVVHTAEGIRKASDLKAFFERSTNSSSHAVADDYTLIDNLVPYDRAAWTLRNGNEESDNLELCGFASWTREEWLTNHQGMLNNAAAWIRSRCKARGIPIVKLSPTQVRAGESGVIGHVDYTDGTGDGTHWDPGPGFPWDVVMARAADAVEIEEENEVKPKICKWTGSDAIWAVTPMGHWQLPTMAAVNNFAFKWGLPLDSNNQAIIDVVGATDWFGPNLDVLAGNAATAAAKSTEAASNTKAAPSA